MKHKTAELEGALLDAAVAKALGWPAKIDSSEDDEYNTVETWCIVPRAFAEGGDTAHSRRHADQRLWRPSTEWDDGGPIIERERISVIREYVSPRLWCAGLNAEIGLHQRLDHASFGTTPLIAAMRAFVASKFGDEVDLP